MELVGPSGPTGYYMGKAASLKTDKVIEQDFETVLKVWRKRYPSEYRAFMREVSVTKSHLHNPDGHTKKRTMMLLSLMPQRLDSVIANLPDGKGGYRYGPGWRKDPKLKKIFDRCFAKAVINRNTEPSAEKLGNRPYFDQKGDPWLEQKLRIIRDRRRLP